MSINFIALQEKETNFRMKLLIIVQHYPPDMMAAARRWGNLLPGLQKEGFDCTVVCAGDGKYREYTGSSGERVIRVAISNIDKSSGVIVKAATQKRKIKRLLRRVIYTIWPPILRGSSVRIWLNKRQSVPELVDIARSSDYIISSYGPIGPFVLGWWLAKKTNKPWIADIRDSFESRYGVSNPLSRSVSRLIERYLLSKASLRLTVGNILAEYLTAIYKLPFHAIYNGWTDYDRIEPTQDFSNIKPYLYYAGSIYAHRLPALTVVLRALQHHPEITLKMRLLKDYTNGEFGRIISQEGSARQIELLPPVPQEIVNIETAQSLGDLVLEDISGTSELKNGTVTGKLIGLLASGCPGIAVCTPKSEIKYLVDKINSWHAVDTSEQCQYALADLKKNRAFLSNSETLNEYSMSAQSKKLAKLINQNCEYPGNL